MSLIKKIISYLRFFANYYILHGGNKVGYLRSQGAKIGANCDLIVPVNYFGSEPYLIKLGNNVTVTDGVMFITHDGATRVFRGSESNWQIGMGLYGTIEIGNDVFIGVNTIILPGVKIGNNSIVGAGSVVTKDVPSGVVVAGNPARVISALEDYKKCAFENALGIDVSSKKAKRHALVRHFWHDGEK